MMEERKERGKETPRKETGYRAFPDVNRIGRPKGVTSIPILLGTIDSYLPPTLILI